MTSMSEQDETDMLATLDAVVADLQEAQEKTIVEDLPEGTRQILIVSDVIMYASNWRASAANRTVGSQPYIKLVGQPAPHSEVTLGYIRFVDAADLREPHYSSARKQITIYVDYRAMAQVLAQLEQANRYLWIGHFAGGHIYGDLHSHD